MKKRLGLILAIILVLTTFIQPIHAAEVSLEAIADDMSPCCGAYAQDVSNYQTHYHNQAGCGFTDGAHNHEDRYKEYYVQCMTCGTVSYMGTFYVNTFCSHINNYYYDELVAIKGWG